jgi:large subunit ribosomal protein L20
MVLAEQYIFCFDIWQLKFLLFWFNSSSYILWIYFFCTIFSPIFCSCWGDIPTSLFIICHIPLVLFFAFKTYLSLLFQHFYGRARNCYSIAIRAVHRALVFATKGRKLKKQDMADVGTVYYKYMSASLSVDAYWVLHGFISSLLLQLWETRITAGCEEHNMTYPLFREGLARCNILLNRKTLADLAIWEPRTFKVFLSCFVILIGLYFILHECISKST